MSPDLRVFAFGSVFYALSAAVGAKAAQPDAARLFVDFALSEAGQKITASFNGVPTTTQVADKLDYVIDDIGAGQDLHRYDELFREIFGASQS